MFEKLTGKGSLTKLITALLIASIGILAISVLTSADDTRRQIVDMDGGSEEELCVALSGIKGVGEVEVLVKYGEEDSVSGVMIIAEGGANPVVASELTRGVATLFGIPVSSVIVFEKEQEE